MKASAGSEGQVFCRTEASDDFGANRVTFTPPVGKKIAIVEIDLKTDTPLTALRLDPTDAVADVEIDCIELRRRDGEVLRRWGFE